MLDQLQQRFAGCQEVVFEQHNELIALTIANTSATARLYLQGAQLTHFQLRGESPVLWLSDHCDYRMGTPLRGGIPICWPWFGDLAKNPSVIQSQWEGCGSQPAHGLLRTQLWELAAIDERGDETELQLTHRLVLATAAGRQFHLALTLTITIGQQLCLRFKVDNLSDQDFFATSALHSYFFVKDISAVSVLGLENTTYVDSLRDWQSFLQAGEVLIDREVDRIYSAVDRDILLQDAAAARQIVLSHSGAPSLVCWNPWTEKAKRLSHFAAEDYRQMLCLESGCVLSELQCIGAGTSAEYGLAIATDTLSI